MQNYGIQFKVTTQQQARHICSKKKKSANKNKIIYPLQPVEKKETDSEP